MKKCLIWIIGIACMMLSFQKGESLKRDSEIVKFMRKNDIKKFLRHAGSEEMAIKELILFALPDTFYNRDSDLIWRKADPEKIAELNYYASRKLQAFYWILKIYNADNLNAEQNEFCRFLNGDGETIWDYEDLDIVKKEYYYKVVLWSPTNHENYFNELGYIRIHSNSLVALETEFKTWFDQMKIHGLSHMRERRFAPVSSSRYKIER